MKKLFILILLVLFLPVTVNAASGCCSSHGGVDCTKIQSNGNVVCNDGWKGSSCSYSGMKKCIGYNPKNVTVATKKKTTTKNNTTVKKETTKKETVKVEDNDTKNSNIVKDNDVKVIKDEEIKVEEKTTDEAKESIEDVIEEQEIVDEDNITKKMSAASITNVVNSDDDSDDGNLFVGLFILGVGGAVYLNRKKMKKI